MNIIGHRKFFFIFSGLLVSASIVAIVVFGFQLGVDLAGGTLWQISLVQTDADAIKGFLETDLKIKNVSVFPAENQSFLIRLGHVSEEEHQSYLSALKEKFGELEELRFEAIGPAIGKELRNRAFWAIALVLLGISLYIAFAFRKVSYPIKSWKYGVITLITLFHDIAIPAGMLSVLGWKWGIEIDTNFIVALLVVMGFSVHDTIVVFDRIRENLLLNRTRLELPVIINASVNQTLARSINTSLTLVLVLLTMFFFGPITLHYFILTLLVGVIAGTYSSIFIASPLLLHLGSSK